MATQLSQATSERRWPPAQAEIPPPRDRSPQPRLDALARLPGARLAERFAAARAPADPAILDGEPVCRALLPGGALASGWARSERFPWIGKSFRQDGPGRLTGHNRLTLFGGARALSFVAAVGPSLLDGDPALILRYDSPGTANPWWQRRIHDELREVEPGLLAGPVMWLGRRGARTLCWFAIDVEAGVSRDRAR